MKRNLILIHRGARYERDFADIGRKVVALDREIDVYAIGMESKSQLPPAIWQNPTLVVAFTGRFNLRLKRGKLLKNLPIDKLLQYETFREAGIPTPPTLAFKFGMMLDPLLFGEFVLIKPMDLNLTSIGDGVQLFRRRRIEQLRLHDFPPEHPLHRDRQGYLVQRFVDTGPNPSFHRVETLFGKILYSWHSTLQSPRCALDAPDAEIERTIIATQGGDKDRKLVKEPDILDLAQKVHAAFASIPLLAIDILRERNTGNLYVLECNPGGNTWHFSSRIGAKLRLGFGNAAMNGEKRAHEIARQMFIEQYGAFDVAAQALVEQTHAHAS